MMKLLNFYWMIIFHDGDVRPVWIGPGLGNTDERGHVGILTQKFFNEFKNKYQHNIISIEYYDNTKLLDDDIKNYVNPINGSHFKIILKK